MRAPQRADWGWSLLERSSNCHIPNIKPLRHSIRNVLPGLKRNKTGKNCTVVQSSLFRWKYILLFIWKSRSWSLKEQWQGTELKMFEVQCEVSEVCDGGGCMSLADVNSCYFSFFYHIQVNTANCWEILEHFMLPLADKSYRDVNFLFQQDLAPGYSPKTATMLLTMLLLSVIGQPNQLTWTQMRTYGTL